LRQGDRMKASKKDFRREKLKVKEFTIT
jgi:hypothetical protein